LTNAADAARALLARGPGAVALFCDFDGTLAEIVPDPSRAVPVPGALDALHGLAGVLGVVAVVSGRPGAYLAERLELASRHSALRAYGHYGAEEVEPDGTVVTASGSRAATELFAALAAEARRLAPAALVEEKGTSLALHFRTSPGDEAALRALAASAAVREGLELREGRMVVELVGHNAPDKGVIVQRLATGREVCCAIGDDIGDLAAFAALDALQAGGHLALRVAVASTERPGELIRRADLVLDGPRMTASFLREILELATTS
jgi:trehalose 6-phosphate phosphatase